MNNNRILFVDLAFRNVGWAVYSRSKRKIVKAGIIQVKGLSKKERAAVGMYVNEENVALCSELAKLLRQVVRTYSATDVVAEVPHAGGQSARAVALMSLATGVLSSVCALEDVKLHCLQPIWSKRLIKPEGGKVSKKETIEHVRGLYDNRFLPKAACVAEHIADALMCLEVVKRRKSELLYDPAKIRRT